MAILGNYLLGPLLGLVRNGRRKESAALKAGKEGHRLPAQAVA